MPVIGMLERYALPGKIDEVAAFLGAETLPPGLQAQFVLQNVEDPASFLLFTVWTDEASRQAYIRGAAFQPLLQRAMTLYDPARTTTRTLAFLRRRGLPAREATGPVVGVREWVARPGMADRAAELVSTGPLPPGLQAEYACRDVNGPDRFVFVTVWASMEARGLFLHSEDFRALAAGEPNSLFDPALSQTRVFRPLRRQVRSDEGGV